jgi:type II secretory pathway pseudopilin PulG
MRKARHAGFTLTEIAIGLAAVGLVLGSIWATVHSVYENNRIAQAETGFTQLSNNLMQAMLSGSLNLPSSDSSSSLAIGNSGWYYSGAINSLVALNKWVPVYMISSSGGAPILINPWSSQTQTTSNGSTQSTADGMIVTIGTLTSGGLTIPANDPTAMAQYAQQDCHNIENQSCIPTAYGVDAFEIAYNNIPIDACVELAMMFGGPSRPSQVVTVFIGMDNWQGGGGIGMGGASPLPITITQASTLCADTGNGFGGSSSSSLGSSFIDIVFSR